MKIGFGFLPRHRPFQDDRLFIEFIPDSQFARVTLGNSQVALVPGKYLREIREISPDELILRKDPGSDGSFVSIFVELVFIYPDKKLVISKSAGVMSKHYPQSIRYAWGLPGGFYEDMRDGRIKDSASVRNATQCPLPKSH